MQTIEETLSEAEKVNLLRGMFAGIADIRHVYEGTASKKVWEQGYKYLSFKMGYKIDTLDGMSGDEALKAYDLLLNPEPKAYQILHYRFFNTYVQRNEAWLKVYGEMLPEQLLTELFFAFDPEEHFALAYQRAGLQVQERQIIHKTFDRAKALPYIADGWYFGYAPKDRLNKLPNHTACTLNL